MDCLSEDGTTSTSCKTREAWADMLSSDEEFSDDHSVSVSTRDTCDFRGLDMLPANDLLLPICAGKLDAVSVNNSARQSSHNDLARLFDPHSGNSTICCTSLDGFEDEVLNGKTQDTTRHPLARTLKRGQNDTVGQRSQDAVSADSLDQVASGDVIGNNVDPARLHRQKSITGRRAKLVQDNLHVQKSKIGRRAKFIQDSSLLIPRAEDLVQACRSLYEDRIEPTRMMMTIRVRELLAQQRRLYPEDLSHCPKVDRDAMLKTIQNCELLQLRWSTLQEYVVNLIGVESIFVRPDCAYDRYPQELWDQVQAYFETVANGFPLPRGYYACAKALSLRNLPFLTSFSLGEIVNIVFMANRCKKIIGHKDDNMVIFRESKEAQVVPQDASPSRRSSSLQTCREDGADNWTSAFAAQQTSTSTAQQENSSCVPSCVYFPVFPVLANTADARFEALAENTHFIPVTYPVYAIVAVNEFP